jgi:hypothetical protein
MVETIINAGNVVCIKSRDNTFPSLSLIIPLFFNKNPMLIKAKVLIKAKLTCPILLNDASI